MYKSTMDDELEDGEIIEISDTATISSNDSDLELFEDIITTEKRKKSKQSNYRRSVKSGRQNGNFAKNENYDMDDYELLIARQKLIQQQLQNINTSSANDITVDVKAKEKQINPVVNHSSSLIFPFSCINKDDSLGNDDDIAELRSVLLLQTSKAKHDTNIKFKQEVKNNFKKQTNPDFVSFPQLKIKPIRDIQIHHKHADKDIQKKTIKKRKYSSLSIDDANLMFRKNITGEKLSKNQRKKANKKIRTIMGSTISSPSFNTRSKNSLRNEDLNNLIDLTKKKRRRGGKRTKYLAIRAQQKKEFEILQKQHEEVVFDNYSTVPMDIEDDNESTLPAGTAPLPLIETLEVQPPPPPNDTFKPVCDQATLQMTNSNVAWMPGYVETLDIQNIYNNNGYVNSNQATKVDTIHNKENQVNDCPSETKEETEEVEVWALRAQALKSLACKRAVKAKKEFKEKPNIKEKTSIVTSTSSASLHVLPLNKNLSKSVTSSSLSSGSSTPTSMLRSNDNFNLFSESPVHPPVIIQLTKDDFITESKTSAPDKKSTINTNKVNLGKKGATKRHILLGDDHLIKELQNTTERSSTILKKMSGFITKDQLKYKKLQTELIEKKTQFDQQNALVEQLQKKLNDVIQQKTATKKSHNKIYTEIKGVKDRLKKKLNIRNKVNEEILRARSFTSVGNMNSTGKFTEKMRNQLLSLNKSIQLSNNEMVNIELLQEGSSTNTINKATTSTLKSDAQTLLQKTAEEIKVMDKKALTKLDSELQQKLLNYQNWGEQSSSSSQVTSSDKEDPIKKIIVIPTLPMVKTMDDLKKLKCSTSEKKTSSIKCNLLELLKQGSSKKQFEVEIININQNNKTDDVNPPDDGMLCKYHSPLLYFKSYRLSPYFRMQSKLSLQSPTYSNKIEAKKIFCKYDVNGSCNDPKCDFWHYKDKCELSANKIIADLLAYDLQTFDSSLEHSDIKKKKLLTTFINQFHTQYASKMSPDERILLIWNRLKESRQRKSKSISECVSFTKRSWLYSQGNSMKDDTEILKPVNPVYYIRKSNKTKNVSLGAEYQEVRYFSEAYDSIAVLEAAVAENPSDIKLWLTLAKKHTHHSKNIEKSETLETTSETTNTEESDIENQLSVLSRGLEENHDSEELWIEYLKLFSKTSSAADLRELCFQAVMYAATYNVWWSCLLLESTAPGKQEICCEIVKFIIELENTNSIDKSHYLLETVLYLCHLLVDRGRFLTALDVIAAALGDKEVSDETEKLQMSDVTKCMTVNDQSLLWMCYISLNIFHHLPTCLFEFGNSCAGRLVCKERFIFDWKRETKHCSEVKIRELFAGALKSIGGDNKDVLKASMILYENLVAFEVECSNTRNAVTILSKLVEKEPSFVEAWVLLLSLYIHHSSTDTIVTVAEDYLHRCEHDIEIVYHYSNWLHKQGMPTLALEKLTKCIHVYFEFDDDSDIPDVLFLYKKVLGLPVPYNIGLTTYLPGAKTSQHLMYYYWLSYCLLLKLRNIEPIISTHITATDEAFETAVHQYTSSENKKKLWIAFIEHRLETLCRQKILSRKDYENLIDLLFQCFMSVPARTVVANNQSIHWIDYNFHNKVLDMCMKYVPSEERSKVYQKAITCMPDNLLLGERICRHEINEGNFEQARVLSGFLLADFPKCLPLWRMAIQVEVQCKCMKEVGGNVVHEYHHDKARWLYEESTTSLPCIESLWKDFALFEISVASDACKLNERLEHIIGKAGEHGVELRETLKKLHT